MFISRLIHIIENYDPYGMHRLNGMKVVYVFFMLSFVNLFFNIPGVYFYYFYIPMTSMSAEVMAERIEDKYKAFILTVLGSSVMALLFHTFAPYPLFFLFSVFLSSFTLYWLALRRGNFFMPLVPIILSLAAYSLLYVDLNMNFRMSVNNMLSTLLALGVVLIALLFFPLHYYYRLWLRAFLLLLEETLENMTQKLNGEPLALPLICGHTQHIVYFSKMLPRSLPVFSILKINLLLNRLHLETRIESNMMNGCKDENMGFLIKQLRGFVRAVKKEEPYPLECIDDVRWFTLIKTWNNLCLNR